MPKPSIVDSIIADCNAAGNPPRKTWFNKLDPSVAEQLLEVRAAWLEGKLTAPISIIYQKCRDRFSLSVNYNQFGVWLRDAKTKKQ